MTSETAIATVTSAEIEQSEEFQSLLNDCRDIYESLRLHDLKHYWLLGQRLCQAMPESQAEGYGTQIRMLLERLLGVDRSTLWRCMQFYQQADQARIFAVRQKSFMTWSKWKMCLPLEESDRESILALIESGELRTDLDVKTAIDSLKIAAGALAPRPLSALRGMQSDLPHLSDRLFLNLNRCFEDAPPATQAEAVIKVAAAIKFENLGRQAGLKIVEDIDALAREVRSRVVGLQHRPAPLPGQHDQRRERNEDLSEAEA